MLLPQDLGTPSDKIWPGPPSYSELPAVKKVECLIFLSVQEVFLFYVI